MLVTIEQESKTVNNNRFVQTSVQLKTELQFSVTIDEVIKNVDANQADIASNNSHAQSVKILNILTEAMLS